MALQRIIIPDLMESLFFDDIFEEMHRDAARMHHDMRHAMRRLTAPEPLSPSDEFVNQEVELFKNPVTTLEDGSKEFQVRFDVSTFKPDEVKVKTDGNELSVEAKHEDKNEHSRVYHHFSRHYTLPAGVSSEGLTSSLSKDGVLTVKGPVADDAIEGPAATKAITKED